MNATRKLLGILAVASQLVAVAPAAGAEEPGASYTLYNLKFCVYSTPETSGTPSKISDATAAGECLGIIEAVLDLQAVLDDQHRFCSGNVDYLQALQIVRRFSADRAETLDLPLWEVSVMAFHAAWPCK